MNIINLMKTLQNKENNLLMGNNNNNFFNNFYQQFLLMILRYLKYDITLILHKNDF